MFIKILKMLSKDEKLDKNILNEQNLKVQIQYTLFSFSTYWAVGLTWLTDIMSNNSFLENLAYLLLYKYLFYNLIDNQKARP